jgi:putative peptidoglycan lipid II flippase
MKSTAVVGSMTLISRVLGFLRDMVIAHHFGASAATDAFFVAFRIPNFLRRLFSEGSFAQALLPILSQHRESGDSAHLKHFIDHAAGTLMVLLSTMTFMGTITAPVLILAFAPGFIDNPGQLDLSVALLIVTLPYLFFITLTAFAGGIFNSVGRFAIPAATPAVLNLTMIAAALWLAPELEQPVMALALAVLVAGILQLAIQIPALAAAGLLPKPKLHFRDREVRDFLKRIAPAVFGVSVTQVNLLVDTLAASFLVSGSVSWLYYSDRLVEFPLGIFGVAIGTALSPQLAKYHARHDRQGFSDAIDWGLRWVLLIGLPATLGLMLLAPPLMSTLFEYDEFGADDAVMASRSLMTYALGLLGFIAVKVLAPGFNARHDVATPVRCGITAMLANALLCPLLAFWLAPEGWSHACLTLATALAALFNAVLLWRALRRDGIYRPNPGWLGFGLRVCIANLAMGFYLSQVGDAQTWHEVSSMQRIVRLAILIASGASIYLASLWLTGTRPRHLALAGQA